MTDHGRKGRLGFRWQCISIPPMINWFFNELLSYIEIDITDIHIEPEDFADFLKKLDDGVISGKIGKSVIKKSFYKKVSLNKIIANEGLMQITDHKTIEKIVLKILKDNPDQVKSYKSGKKKLFSYFIGEVMKQTKGKANPQLVNEILKVKINEM